MTEMLPQPLQSLQCSSPFRVWDLGAGGQKSINEGIREDRVGYYQSLVIKKQVTLKQ